jgi:hypothetical protein
MESEHGPRTGPTTHHCHHYRIVPTADSTNKIYTSHETAQADDGRPVLWVASMRRLW